ncbi:multiple epidermal growth factor-like domains protein 10 isoform X2 [Mytilus californianus]|uniref:multiple epidermal growth factor-like domains protein 10 isoform X2 n=1 Tax=Mytilus californianus TaxID=6549 RepID=UPI002245115F|nr:multiple epidermal growth factor-like domains protein 10 isoform X2 [Mytilus californianus]
MKMISKLQQGVLLIIATLFVPVRAQINLALHGTVAQETTYTDASGIDYTANLAIEGPANNNWEDGCSATAVNKTAWWGLFLPRLAYITNVKSYYRKDAPTRMNGFRLYLANGSLFSTSVELCYRDWKNQAYLNLNQSIDLDNNPTKNIYFFNRNTKIELCYIEIYGCWKGTWGPNCTTDCPVECIGSHCFPQNGSCIWGCDEQKCNHGECHARTDVCTKGCVPGRGGRYCTFYNTVYNRTAKQSLTGPSLSANVLTDGNTTSCISIVSTSSKSYMQIGNESLIVITGVYLFFGDMNPSVGIHKVYCSNTTDSWAEGTVLYNAEHHNNDTDVFAVCKYIIYIPPILNGNSKIDICEIEIGGCPYGKYGDSCQLTCPENCIGPCDLITGNCLFGCLVGWLGKKCDRACDEGKFGDQCLRDCSANCLSPPCDYMTGKCTAGCKKGWERFNCTEECSNGNFGWNCSETCDGCIVNECDHISGDCKIDSVCKPGYVYGKYCNQICEDWHFGTNCNKKCNCLKKPCNIFTGECSDDGCKMGWKGDSCDQECVSGYFGFNCAYFCETCFNQSCDIFEGNCRVGCNDGYRGRKCETPVSAESSAIIRFGFFIGGLASMFVFLLIIWMVINARRRILKKQDSRKAINDSHSNSNEQHYDDIMKMEGLSAYQDLAKQTDTVSNDYDQINNAYVNQ